MTVAWFFLCYNIGYKLTEYEEDNMISFASDYIAGAHPSVLQKLVDTNLECLSGYGTDVYCASAIEKIKKACDCPEAQVYFLVGGTQTNEIVISTMLDDSEGVIAAKTGHINAHEAGAVEYTGHKVIGLDETEGKLKASSVKAYLSNFYQDENHEHMVFPGMVYISYPTEYGTLYSREELEELYQVCKEFDVKLFVDGARLGYGLASRACDITMADLAKLCDVFYIGGTKVGALCGEAVVFTGDCVPKHFMSKIKQHGALLAKGRLLGIQFDALFTDCLYHKISQHAIDMAEQLKTIFAENGFQMLLDSPTNQQFVVLENELLAKLRREVEVSFWDTYDAEHSVVRFATSWSTTQEDIDALSKIIHSLS